MKKLLTIFTAFGISTSAGLSIISCANSKEQKVIDNAVEQLKDKSFLIVVADGKINTVKNAIKNCDNFKTILQETQVEIKSWQFKKDDYYINSNFENDVDYQVILNIKKENDNKTIIKENSVNFKIKLKINDNYSQKLKQAILNWEKIKNVILDVEMAISTNNWTKYENATIKEVISKFEQLDDYKAGITEEVNLKKGLKLYKVNDNGEEVKARNIDLIDNADIVVKAALNCNTESKIFKFNVKLAKINHPIDLSTIIDLQPDSNSNLNYSVNSTKTYCDLNQQINNLNLFKNKPLAIGYQIKYYDTETDEKEITSENQQTGFVYVQIIAANDDPNWQGKTERIKITLAKSNLNNIKTLTNDSNTSLTFKSDALKTYKDIEEQIVNAIEFKNKPLKTGYQIKYFTWSWLDYSEITSDSNQKVDKIYVEIIAADNDPNWDNQTNKIAITFTKRNLNTVSTLKYNNDFKVDTTGKYHDLDSQIINANEFSGQALKNGYQIKY